MKNEQTIQRDAIRTAPVGLAALVGRLLRGILTLLLISATFGGRAWAITGGQADNGQHPNVCAVIARHPEHGLLPFSGTLIHPRVILTAGHAAAMVASGEATLHGVSFEQNANLADPSTWLPVSAVAVAFTGISCNPHGMEIGAIILAAPVVGITPATLPPLGLLDWLRNTEQLQPGPNATEFTVVGYGFGLDWPPPQPIYPVSDDGLVARNAAQSVYMSMNNGWLHLSQSLARGYGGTALGDSGGPVFWTDPATSQDCLVGITSGGDMSWVATGTYFRVDTVWSLNFIQDAIEGLEPK